MYRMLLTYGESHFRIYKSIVWYSIIQEFNKTVCLNRILFFLGGAFDFCGFCVIIHFFIPVTTANDIWLRRISIPEFIHYIFCPIIILQKEPVFPSLMLSAKHRHYWYHFYNVLIGMTRSLTGDWIRDLPHSKPALYH